MATVLKVFDLEDIAAAMQSLPERWRAVLWYAEVMDLPLREIAPLLGIEPHAAFPLLIRARTGLRTAYELQTQPAQGLWKVNNGKEGSNGDSIPAT